MDIHKMETEMYELVREFKNKPAMVIAKFYLTSKTNETYLQQLNELLIQRLELFSETDGTKDVDFLDVYNLAESINSPNDEKSQIKISHIFHSIRKNSKLFTHQIEDVLNNTTDNTLPRILVCRAFCSSMMNDTIGMFKSIMAACNTQNVLETRSILFSFSDEQLGALKEELIEGRKKRILTCTCNGGRENFGFSKSTQYFTSRSTHYITSSYTNEMEETSFTDIYPCPPDPIVSLSVCDLHRVISEVDEIMEKLKARDYDATPIYLAHKNAHRYEHAESFLLKHKGCIEKMDERKYLKIT